MEVERIQDVASKTLDIIPSEFIRVETEQPGITTYTGPIPEIPTIDLSEPDQSKLVDLIANASTEWGFFQIVNHGIPPKVVQKLQKAGKEFFELPQEEKEVYAKDPESRDIQGYGTKLQKELTGKKAWVDHLFHNIWPPTSINYRFWPNNPSYYREANEEYAQQLRVVADKLFTYLSLGLGVQGHVLREAVGGDDIEYLLKINYYPPCPRPDLAIGVPPHTDMCAMTLLVPNDITGLQVFQDGKWIDAKYIPNAVIVHIGDQLEILSNGKYKGVFHRACVNKDRTRISWPVFISPPKEKVVGPLPQLVNEKNPAKFKTKVYKDYQYCKLNKIPQ